jgi:hypothetical protein
MILAYPYDQGIEKLHAMLVMQEAGVGQYSRPAEHSRQPQGGKYGG